LVERHKYGDGIIRLCVSLVCGCGISLRGAVKAVELFNDQLHLGIEEIPSYTSITNWIEKSGYFTCTRSRLKESGAAYGVIIDESMQIGSEKLLLILGTRADKKDDSPLKTRDVEVLDMSVEKNWNGALIRDRLKAVTAKMGSDPAYAVSDNASIMNRGIRESSLVHLRDVGHTLAMFLERQYRDAPDFLSLMKELARVKNREVMRPVAYLLPPKQRIIARFMNLAPCIRWAGKMSRLLDTLPPGEREVFQFLENHESLIRELNTVIPVFNRISTFMKEKGLSQKSVEESIQKLMPLVDGPFPRVSRAVKECMAYLREEAGKSSAGEDAWHISSDILESMFGAYKARKSPNALNGVTPYVLMLPLLTKVNPESGSIHVDFKQALESVFLRDIDQWADDNLSENLAVKRRKKLNAA
jgi:hypothetical protein